MSVIAFDIIFKVVVYNDDGSPNRARGKDGRNTRAIDDMYAEREGERENSNGGDKHSSPESERERGENEIDIRERENADWRRA